MGKDSGHEPVVTDADIRVPVRGKVFARPRLHAFIIFVPE